MDSFDQNARKDKFFSKRLHGCHLRSASAKAPAALCWNDLLGCFKLGSCSDSADSNGAILPDVVGVLGGVLNGSLLLSSTMLTDGGPKSEPLRIAAASLFMGICAAAAALAWLVEASASACSTVHSGARTCSDDGSSLNRLR